ncbi:MAG: hypothetical protein EXR79_13865 [Myxococcales bacterium]|nr:hypothetical protein [Myxococcales bacterium]
MRTATDGKLLWNQAYGGSDHDRARSFGRAYRGGSYCKAEIASLRASTRSSGNPDDPGPSVGCRCARLFP